MKRSRNSNAAVSAILLAAGESRRMGKAKLLMPFGYSTILEQSLANFLGSVVGEAIVVVGHQAEDITKLIADRPVKLALNPDYEQGMSTSIIAGLGLVDEGAVAVMLALADQPLIDSQTINKLLEEFGRHDKGIAVPTYRGKRGHPIIFDMKYKEELLCLKGDVGGRGILEKHPDDILEVAVNDKGVCVDIDTLDGYYLNRNSLKK